MKLCRTKLKSIISVIITGLAIFFLSWKPGSDVVDSRVTEPYDKRMQSLEDSHGEAEFMPQDSGDMQGETEIENAASRKSDGVFMSYEEIAAVENLGLYEKLLGVSIISKVDKDKINQIYNMAKDGLTYTEMDEIKHILEKYLSADEIDALREILEKDK